MGFLRRSLPAALFCAAFLALPAPCGDTMYGDGQGKLRLLDYDSCQFAAGEGRSGGRNLVTTDGSTFSQTLFDPLCRITERTEWRSGTSSGGCVLLGKKSYRYRSDSDPADVLPAQLTETRYDRHTVAETFFDAAGNPVREQLFSTAGGRRAKLSETSRSYDASRRLTEETVRSYDGKTPLRRTVYRYTGKSSRPDSSYYEDGVLRVVTAYSSENSCVVDTYFERDYVVSVHYTDGRRTLELVTVGGKERSRRKFDED